MKNSCCIVLLLHLSALLMGQSPALNWEKVPGITSVIRAIGASGNTLYAADNTGLYRSTDTAQHWTKLMTWRDPLKIWIQNDITFVYQPRSIFPVNGNSTEYRLYRTVGDGNLQLITTITPYGAMGSIFSLEDLLWVDDSTVYRITSRSSFQGTQYFMSYSTDKGIIWTSDLPWKGNQTVFANTPACLYTCTGNRIIRYQHSPFVVKDTIEIPVDPNLTYRTGYIQSDTIHLLYANGFHLSKAVEDTLWQANTLPFPAISNAKKNYGYLFISTQNGLFKTSYPSSNIDDYQLISENPAVFIADGFLFRQSGGVCNQVFCRNIGTAEWKPLDMLGFDTASSLYEVADTLYAYNFCRHRLQGDQFVADSSIFNLYGYRYKQAYFKSIESDSTLLLRTLNWGQSWDTVFSISNANGVFYSCPARLFFVNAQNAYYTDDLGETWGSLPFGAETFWPLSRDTLIRKITQNNVPVYLLSTDGGFNWIIRPAIDHVTPDKTWLNNNALVQIYPNMVRASTDLGETFTIPIDFGANNWTLNSWWHQDNFGILQITMPSYPICIAAVYMTTDGGLTWTSQSMPFTSKYDCGVLSLEANYHFATQYLVYQNWLYAVSTLESVWRADISAFAPTVSASEIQLPVPEITLMPNPAENSATVQWPEAIHCTAGYLYQVDGRLIQHKILNEADHHWQLDLASIPQGTYYLRLLHGQSSVGKILIKI